MATSLDNYYISVYGPSGTNSLKHYFPLSESVGATTAVDSVGGQNGTNTLIAAGVTDIVPTSDGSTCYTFAAGAGINLGAPFALGTGSQFAWEAWIKPSSLAGFPGLYQNGVDAHGNNGWYDTGGSALNLSTDNSSTNTSGVTISINNVYHVVMGYNGTNRLIYVNGVLRGNAVAAAGSAPTTSNLIGRWQSTGDGGSWLGQMQKICYYNQMLTQTQVTNNYNAGLTGPPATGGVIAPPMGGNLAGYVSGGFAG